MTTQAKSILDYYDKKGYLDIVVSKHITLRFIPSPHDNESSVWDIRDYYEGKFIGAGNGRTELPPNMESCLIILRKNPRWIEKDKRLLRNNFFKPPIVRAIHDEVYGLCCKFNNYFPKIRYEIWKGYYDIERQFGNENLTEKVDGTKWKNALTEYLPKVQAMHTERMKKRVILGINLNQGWNWDHQE